MVETEVEAQLQSNLLVQLPAELMPLIMESEFVFVTLDFTCQEINVFKELLVMPTAKELLMEDANVFLDSPAIMEFALNVLQELFGAQHHQNAFLFVDKTQLTQMLLKLADVLMELD